MPTHVKIVSAIYHNLGLSVTEIKPRSVIVSERFYKLMGVAALAYALSFVPAKKEEQPLHASASCKTPTMTGLCK